MSREKIADFNHYGISPWEIEVIYDTLKRSFQVEEKQLEPDDPSYVSMMEIGFPISYDDSFFQTFTIESWFKIKGVIKDVKRRRGRKGIKILIRFVDSDKDNFTIVFPLLSKGDKEFEMGMERIEFLVDVVPVQIRSIPAGTRELWYAYDESCFKWNPSLAKSNGIKYAFKNGEWKII